MYIYIIVMQNLYEKLLFIAKITILFIIISKSPIKLVKLLKQIWS